MKYSITFLLIAITCTMAIPQNRFRIESAENGSTLLAPPAKRYFALGVNHIGDTA